MEVQCFGETGVEHVDAQTDESHGGQRSGKGVGPRSSVAFLVEAYKAVLSVLDEYHVRKILIANLRNFPACVDLFVLNVFGGQKLFEAFELPVDGVAGEPANLVRGTRRVGSHAGR